MALNSTLRPALFYLFWVLVCATGTVAYAQVGIGTNSPRPRAALELRDTARGFLPPRLTNVQRDALTPLLGPADAGMLIYSLTDSNFAHWNGSFWDTTGGGGGQSLWSRYGQRYVGLQDHQDSVSIGAPTPEEKLHIHGNIRGNGFLKLGNNPPAGSLVDIANYSFTGVDPLTNLGWLQSGPKAPCTNGDWTYSPGLGATFLNNTNGQPHHAELTSSSFFIPSNYLNPFATFHLSVPGGVDLYLDFEVSVNGGAYTRVPDAALNFSRTTTPNDCNSQPTQPALAGVGIAFVTIDLTAMGIQPGNSVVFQLVGRGDGNTFDNIVIYSFKLTGYVAEPGGVYANSATFGNLQGFGNRMVVADDRGALSVQPLPVIPSTTWNRSGNELTPDNNSNVSIGINTPGSVNANLHVVGTGLTDGHQNITQFLNIGGTPFIPVVNQLVNEEFLFNPFNSGYAQNDICGGGTFVWDGVGQRINLDVVNNIHATMLFPNFNLFINSPSYTAEFDIETGGDFGYDGFLIEASINGGPFQNVVPFSTGLASSTSIYLCNTRPSFDAYTGVGNGTVRVNLTAMGANAFDQVQFRITGGGDVVVNSFLRLNAFRLLGGNAPTSGSLIANTARFSSLGGVATRMVVADGDGNLSTQPIPGGGGGAFTSNSGVITPTTISDKVLFGTTGSPTANVEFWDDFGDNMSVVGNDANIGFATIVGNSPFARIGIVATPGAPYSGSAAGDLYMYQGGSGRIVLATGGGPRLEINSSGVLSLPSYSGSGTRNLVVNASGEVGVAVAGGLTGSGASGYIPRWNSSTDLTTSALYQSSDSAIAINSPFAPSNRALTVHTSTQPFGLVAGNSSGHPSGSIGISSIVSNNNLAGNPSYAIKGEIQFNNTNGSAAVLAQNTSFSGRQYGLYATTGSPDSASSAVFAQNTGNFGVGAAIIGEVSFGDEMKAIYGKAFSGYGGYFEGKGYFSGNVGIGALPTFSERLYVAGTVRAGFNLVADNDIIASNRVSANQLLVNSMAGGGNRMVVVDNSGNFSASPLPAAGALPLAGLVVAYHTTGGLPQVIPPNTLVSLRSENESQDFLGAYNDTIFTVPAGVTRIRVNAQVGFVFPSGSGIIEFYLERNDNPNQLAQYASCWAKSSILETANISTGLIDVSPGETFKLKVLQNSSSSQTVSWGTFFTSGVQFEMYGNP